MPDRKLASSESKGGVQAPVNGEYQGPYAVEMAFTDAYRRHQSAHVAIREAMCLRAQFPGALDRIAEGDLIAGRLRDTLVGFSPDENPGVLTTFGYWANTDEITRRLEQDDLSETERTRLERLLSFWRHEETSARLRRAYPPKMAEALPSDNWMAESGIAFPLYRLTGGNVNFEKFLKIGIPGLAEEIDRCRKDAVERGGDPELFEAMGIALDVLVESCRYYRDQALLLAEQTRDPKRKSELRGMAEVLDAVTVRTPAGFKEAVQLFWLYTILADVRNYGRMDVYLGDFLVQDLDTGVLTEDEALRVLQSLWWLMVARQTRVHCRVIIGGVGRPNEANADRFAMLAMEATRTVHEVVPQLSLRFYKGQNPALYQKALDVIGEGRTFPILYNDDVNVDAAAKALRVSREEAEQWVPFGCGEYIIDHKGFGTPSGVINLLKALEVTLRNGKDPVTGADMGLKLGHFRDFKTFDDLLAAYKKQVEHYVLIMAEHEALEYQVAGDTMACLYQTMLYDDCLPRGKALFSGGLRYLGGTLETYGNTSCADSLTAIKKLVYDEKKITPDELLDALDANFEGYEKIRKLLLNAPKYGNDDPEADAMLLEVHNHVCRYVEEQADRVGLHSYNVVIINNSANTLMGRSTHASADGRKAFEPMSNGNAPSGGSDQNGPTAMLNSIVKPDSTIHAGAVQNMKFSRGMFREMRPKLEALLDTYWANGGTQAMITVVDRNELERALQNPEHYRHIFVRVGGFTARFVDLPRDVQQDILSRTLY